VEDKEDKEDKEGCGDGVGSDDNQRDDDEVEHDFNDSGHVSSEDEESCCEYNDYGDVCEDEESCQEYNDRGEVGNDEESCGKDNDHNHDDTDNVQYCTEEFDYSRTSTTPRGTMFADGVVSKFKSCPHCNSTKEKVSIESKSDSAKAQRALRFDLREVSFHIMYYLELLLD
jgi:hypothetical protein